MCLDSRKTKKEMDKWLKTQPDIITAYKLVSKIEIEGKEDKLIPLYFSKKTRKYKKKNRIRGDRPFTRPAYHNSSRRPYKAYFHLWLEIPGDHEKYSNTALIKCHVPKHLITAVGIDGGTPTIVSKGFDIVSGCPRY